MTSAAAALPSDAECVGIVATNSLDFVEAVFRCQREGQVSVPLRSLDDDARIDAAGVTRIVQPSLRTGWGGGAGPVGASDRVAQILFTSGTTGEPKGTLLSDANIANTTERLNAVMRLDDSVREYVGIPVYHSFGMGRCRAVRAAGGEYFLPENGFDPSEIARMLADDEINAISAVPTLWRVLLQNAQGIEPHGGRLRWIEIGSQSMDRSEKEALKHLFPNAIIVQHYGSTEASRSTFLEIHATEGEALESVGSPTGGVEIRIGVDDGIQIRGPHVAASQIVHGTVVPLPDSEGWFTSGDVGRMQDGRLYFGGRADDLINCGGVKIQPEELERRIVIELGGAEEIAASRVPDALRGDGLLVAHTPGTGRGHDEIKRAAARAAESFGLKAAAAITVREIAEIPRTDTGKIRRGALADAAAPEAPARDAPVEAAPERAREPAASGLEAELVAVWEEILDVQGISTDQSFFDLGGDSLSAITAMLQLESLGLSNDVARAMLNGSTIREIVAASEATGEAAAPAPKSVPAALNEASNFMRGVVILAILGSHWVAPALPREGLASALLAPLFSMGTPTLAVLFGLSVVFSYRRQYESNRAAFHRSVRLGFSLLVAGIVGYLGIQELASWSNGQPISAYWIVRHLVGPLDYFAIAVVSLPLWTHTVDRSPAAPWRFLFLAMAVLAANQLVIGLLPETIEWGPAQTLADIGVGRWGLLCLGPATLGGVALALVMQRKLEEDPRLAQFLPMGIALFGGGIVGSIAAGVPGVWFEFPKVVDLWSILAHTGLLLTLIALYGRLGDRVRRRPLLRTSFEGVCCFGILLFPLYVLQSFVWEGARIVSAFSGWEMVVALPLCIAAFFAIASVPLLRVYRLYYA